MAIKKTDVKAAKKAEKKEQVIAKTSAKATKVISDEIKPKKESRLKILKLRPEKKAETDFQMNDPYEILRFVLMTEKSVRMVEAQNKLVFIVDRRYDKKEIKQAAKEAFSSEIESVNTSIDQKGRKKAYIKFVKPGQAGDIAVRLGII